MASPAASAPAAPVPAAPAEASTGPAAPEGLSLSALLHVAARARADEALIGGGAEVVTAGRLAQRVDRLASMLAMPGLPPAADALIAAPMGAELALALLGSLKAGLSPVLLPVTAGDAGFREIMDRMGPSLAIAALEAGDIPVARHLRDAAARSFQVRLVAAFGDEVPDGVLGLDPLLASAASLPGETSRPPRSPGPIRHVSLAGDVTIMDEAAIVAAAIEVARACRLGPSTRIVSTLLGTDFAAWVTGFAAGLVSWAEFVPVGLRPLARLAELFPEDKPVCLVIPAMVEAALREAGIADHLSIATLVVVHGAEAIEPLPDPAGRRVIDVLRPREGGIAIKPRD